MHAQTQSRHAGYKHKSGGAAPRGVAACVSFSPRQLVGRAPVEMGGWVTGGQGREALGEAWRER